MNRERAAWLLSLLLITIAAFRSPSAAQRDNDYLFVRTLVDINRHVVGNYVEPVQEEKLEQAAINGGFHLRRAGDAQDDDVRLRDQLPGR